MSDYVVVLLLYAAAIILQWTYQYQKHVVADLAADCANTASVHTLFSDLSRHGKQGVQKTAKM